MEDVRIETYLEETELLVWEEDYFQVWEEEEDYFQVWEEEEDYFQAWGQEDYFRA